MRRVVYHPKVPSEVREIMAYYEGIGEQLAIDFWNELLELIEYAKAYPERHHFDPSGRRRSNLQRFPYHFLFCVFEHHIRVTVVRHNSRCPGFGGRRS